MSKTFLDAYRETIFGCPSYPSDQAAADQLLTLFLLDKGRPRNQARTPQSARSGEIPLSGVVDLLLGVGIDHTARRRADSDAFINPPPQGIPAAASAWRCS
jgi:hypothetical protein